MKHRGAPCARHLRIVALLLAFGLLTACKTSQEAINAATQLSTVSQQLTAYYTDLSNQVADTITLQEMYAEQNSRAMNEDLKTYLNTTQEELAKRVALAQALGKLANAYAALANSKAATDISTAAEGLANECKSIAPLPGGSAIPDVVSVASKQLVEYVRQRKLRKSSDAISEIVLGVQAMFASEMKAYETQNKERLRIAASVSRQLLKQDAVEVTPALAPALKPFNLTAKPQPNQTPADLRGLAELEISRTVETQNADFAATTQSLSLALKAANEQVKLVAGKKH